MRALLLSLWCVSAVAVAGTPDLGPPPAGHWAKDVSGKISPATLASLDEIAGRLNGTGNGQLGVLVVRTTSGRAPRTFATEVFNRWGVGHRDYKNGILLFVALDDRKAEIILGDGLERISTGDTDAVMRDQVVSNFKAGRPEQALIEGATALAALLTPAHVKPEAVMSTQDALSEEKVSELFRTGTIADPSPRKWVIDLTGEVPSETVHAVERLPNELYASDARPLFIVFFRSKLWSAAQVRERAQAALNPKHPRAALMAVNLDRPDTAFAFPLELRGDARSAALELAIENEAKFAPELGNVTEATSRAAAVLINGFPMRSPTEVVREAVDRHGPIFWALGGFMLVGGGFWARRWNRYRSRTCETCQRARQLLPPEAEHKHLSDGQKTEQRIGSIDYDVWWCGVCRSVLLRDNTAWFSGYSGCKQCKNSTLSSSSTTLVHATEYSGGTVRVDEKCAHCSYTNSYTRHTARIVRTRTSSSSSSSSSSRSSFGGGSSSGRGSSGSW